MARFSSKLWIFFSLIFLAILLCVWLGFWQLNRADQKNLMVEQHLQMTKQEPTALTKTSKPLQYQPVKLTGRYLVPLLYLDNQHYQHNFGYDIISPFQTDGGLVVLVDRGGVAGDVTRQSLPQIDTPKEKITIEGYVYYPNQPILRLGPQLEIKQGDRYLLEQIDIGAFQALFPIPIAHYTLRLLPSSNYGFIREWPIVAMSPSRHIGYAIQWFVMAFCLIIVMGYFLKSQYETQSK